MVELLKWLALISVVGGGIVGALMGNNVGIEFSYSVAAPYWISGIISGIIFAVLSEVLFKVRAMYGKVMRETTKEP